MMRLLGFFIITLSLFLQTGCQQEDGGTSPPSMPLPFPKKATVEVTIGGKVWEIDPTLSYQATGIWRNPNPRPLTDTEKQRLEALPTRIQELETQIDELDKELRYLERIEAPLVETHYNFGKPPRFSSDGLPKIIDLGEFPIEMDMPSKIPAEP